MPGGCFRCAAPLKTNWFSRVQISNLRGVAEDGTKLALLNGLYYFRCLIHGEGAVYGLGQARHARAVVWHHKAKGRWVLSRAVGSRPILTCQKDGVALPTSGWEPPGIEIAHIPGPDFAPYCPSSIHDLRCLLITNEIDPLKFGACSTYHKSLEDLWWELQKKLCLFEVCHGTLRRVISCVRLTVYCYDVEDGKRYELREENEIRGDGQEINLFTGRQSFMKKLFHGEDWREGVARALALDLRARDPCAFVLDDHIETTTMYESRYPGLPNNSTLHEVLVQLKLPIEGIGNPASGEQFVTEEESLIGPSMQRLHFWRWIAAKDKDAWKIKHKTEHLVKAEKGAARRRGVRSTSENLAYKLRTLRGGRFSIPASRPHRTGSQPEPWRAFPLKAGADGSTIEQNVQLLSLSVKDPVSVEKGEEKDKDKENEKDKEKEKDKDKEKDKEVIPKMPQSVVTLHGDEQKKNNKYAMANQLTKSTTFGSVMSQLSSSASLSFNQVPRLPDQHSQDAIAENAQTLAPVTESHPDACAG